MKDVLKNVAISAADETLSTIRAVKYAVYAFFTLLVLGIATLLINIF